MMTWAAMTGNLAAVPILEDFMRAHDLTHGDGRALRRQMPTLLPLLDPQGNIVDIGSLDGKG